VPRLSVQSARFSLILPVKKLFPVSPCSPWRRLADGISRRLPPLSPPVTAPLAHRLRRPPPPRPKPKNKTLLIQLSPARTGAPGCLLIDRYILNTQGLQRLRCRTSSRPADFPVIKPTPARRLADHNKASPKKFQIQHLSRHLPLPQHQGQVNFSKPTRVPTTPHLIDRIKQATGQTPVAPRAGWPSFPTPAFFELP